MEAKKYEVVVRSIQGAATIEVKTSCQNKSEISKEIEEIAEAMNIGLTDKATVGPPQPVSPTFHTRVIGESPSLTKPPHSYTPTDAVREVLNPNISEWGQKSRSVREIQELLIQLGIPGMTAIKTLDRVIRALTEGGDLKREKIGRVWKYYLSPKGKGEQ